MFLTRWEEELCNDKMGIETKNPYTDFISDGLDNRLQPARKRQRILCHGPWWEPSSRTMRIVQMGRLISTTKLRKDWLKDGFFHWRKLVSLGYPQRQTTKFITGLKDAAREVSQRRQYLDIVLAAKADMFKEAFKSEEDLDLKVSL